MDNVMDNKSEAEPLKIDIEIFLDPAKAFHHPRHLLSDEELTSDEKLSILVIWAKRICAEDAIPELFFTADKCVRFDDVMDAIDQLDRRTEDNVPDDPRTRIREKLRAHKSTGLESSNPWQRVRSVPILIGGKVVD
jgi:hypothetical protein